LGGEGESRRKGNGRKRDERMSELGERKGGTEGGRKWEGKGSESERGRGEGTNWPLTF